jgi:hypothetical protein
VTRLLFVLLLVSAGLCAHAQAPCRVLDPSLQGHYEGACKDGLAEGKGTAIGQARYVGEFAAGRKHGHGTYLYPSGDAYTGDWREDRREGSGTYVWGPDSPWRGDRYMGDYRNDRRHGRGEYVWAFGDRYEGEWRDGVQAGPPTMAQVLRLIQMQKLGPVIGKAGARVCSTATDGAEAGRVAHGVVKQLEDDRALIEIDTPAVLQASDFKKNPRWEFLTDWRPCE